MNQIQEQKRRGVLFVRDATIDIYLPNLKTVYNLQFTMQAYGEMEFIDIDIATTQVMDFFAINKIPPSDFILLIQNPLYKKEFNIAPTEQFELAIKNYLDRVPFDMVLSKRIKTEKGVYIIAANGDYFATLQKLFMKVGYVIESITPLDGLDTLIRGIKTLTPTTAEYILKNGQSIKQEGFPLSTQHDVGEFEIVETGPVKQEKSQLPLLIGIFVVLFGILIVVYLQSNSPPPKKILPPTKSIKVPMATPSITPIQAGTQLKNSTVTSSGVKITGATTLASQANTLKQRLTSAGITLVSSELSGDIINPRTVVIFSSSTKTETRTTILNMVQLDFPGATGQESVESPYEAMIVLGK